MFNIIKENPFMTVATLAAIAAAGYYFREPIAGAASSVLNKVGNVVAETES